MNQDPMLQILKSMGFKYRKCNDERELLLQQSSHKSMFLRTVLEIRCSGTTHTCYLDELWIKRTTQKQDTGRMSGASGRVGRCREPLQSRCT